MLYVSVSGSKLQSAKPNRSVGSIGRMDAMSLDIQYTV